MPMQETMFAVMQASVPQTAFIGCGTPSTQSICAQPIIQAGSVLSSMSLEEPGTSPAAANRGVLPSRRPVSPKNPSLKGHRYPILIPCGIPPSFIKWQPVRSPGHTIILANQHRLGWPLNNVLCRGLHANADQSGLLGHRFHPPRALSCRCHAPAFVTSRH